MNIFSKLFNKVPLQKDGDSQDYSCPYYRKEKAAMRKLKGISGCCLLQNKDIYHHNMLGHIPHDYCEGNNGRSNSYCGIFVSHIEE